MSVCICILVSWHYIKQRDRDQVQLTWLTVCSMFGFKWNLTPLNKWQNRHFHTANKTNTNTNIEIATKRNKTIQDNKHITKSKCPTLETLPCDTERELLHLYSKTVLFTRINIAVIVQSLCPLFPYTRVLLLSRTTINECQVIGCNI